MYFISITIAGLLYFATAFSADSTEIEKPEPFACDNTVYASTTSIGTVTTELVKIDPIKLTPISVIKTKNFGYDATAFNHRDGFVYAISSYNASGDPTPHLLRMGIKGDIEDLGSIPELSGSDWIIGTFLADGTYVIGNFGFDWIRLDVENKKALDRGTSEYFNPSTWSTHPRENKIYGYQSAHQKMVVFDPMKNSAFKMYGPQMTNVGVQSCTSAFSQSGQYRLSCKTTDINVDNLFEVDLKNSVAAKTGSYPSLSIGEMATCAFSRPLPKPKIIIKMKTAHNN